MTNKYNKTVFACCISYVTQAIVANFAPLLFVQFSKQYSVSLSQISLLIFICFGVQLIVDAIAAYLNDRIDHRKVAILSQVSAIIGIAGFTFFPRLLPSPFLGLIVAELFAGIGGGLMEVIISPIIEACPATNKTGRMSLLHSFYSWGQAITVLLTTVVLHLIGVENWWVMALVWTAVPLTSIILFTFVPIPQASKENAFDNTSLSENKSSFSGLFKTPLFYLFVVVMLCSGAAELSMAQWTSSFAETGLGVSKAIGDILGPCLFAITMGSARLIFARVSAHSGTVSFLILSSALCIASYLITALSPIPLIALFGCALCGFSVGAMWPGALSLAASRVSDSVACFALMAMAGDLGAMIGPAMTGAIAEALGGNIGHAYLFSLIFPVVLFVIFTIRFKRNSTGEGAKR